jgi:hypothetical protein
VVKYIFYYLKGIIDARLVFENGDGALTGYVDSDFEGDLDKRRSLTGTFLPLVSVQLVGSLNFNQLLHSQVLNPNT